MINLPAETLYTGFASNMNPRLVLFCAAILTGTVLHVDSAEQCTFPEWLVGKWEDQNSKQFEFATSTEKNVKTVVWMTGGSSDFVCDREVDETESGASNVFVLRSTKTIPVFYTTFNLYFCLAVKGDQYVIWTGKNNFLNDNMVAYPVGKEPTAEYVCNEKGSNWVSWRQISSQPTKKENTIIDRILEEFKELNKDS